jgi:phage-related protein
MDMAERLQQRCAFDGDLHFSIRPLAWTSPKGVRKVARACVFRKGDGA